jgi:hypothetical protein
METISTKPQSILEKLGYKVLSIKTRKLDSLNTHFGNVGFTYVCLNMYGHNMNINISFHTHEKNFSMAAKNTIFRRKGHVNNTVFPY